MRCEVCGRKTRSLYLLPLKQPDGKFDTHTCYTCCCKSGAYCRRHQQIHQGFADRTHACLSCIEATVQQQLSLASEVTRTLRNGIREVEFNCLWEWALFSSDITHHPPEVCILRAVVSLAHRRDQIVAVVITQALTEHSVADILAAGIL